MTGQAPTVEPLGDCAITVTFGNVISGELSRAVIHSAGSLQAARLEHVTDIVPSYASLAVFYDPIAVGFEAMRDCIIGALSQVPETRINAAADSRVVRIPVLYDGRDLDDVSRLTGLSRREIVALHTGREYTALAVGFAPGFAYLGELDPRLALPRRGSPRTRVPAGSVAIAEMQTGVYPSSTPGGWHLIGTTDLVMFDPHRAPPALLRVGDKVIFQGTAQ